MLTRWMLENFKPINGLADLAINDITVFAGLNSSGKSSILQSILLVSQTLSNPNPDKVLILNGPIVRLGTFEGTLNDRASEPRLRVAFELSPADSRGRRLSPNPAKTHHGRPFPFSDHKLSTISTSVAFEAASQQGQAPSGIDAVKVILSEARVEVELAENGGGGARRVVASVLPLSEEEEHTLLSEVEEEYHQLVPYPSGGNYLTDLSDELPRKPVLTRLLHFLPHRLLRKFNVWDRKQEELMTLIEFVFDGRASRANQAHLHPRIVQILTHEPSQHFLSRLHKIAQHEGARPFTGDSISKVLDWMREVSAEGATSPGFVASVKDAITAEFTVDADTRRQTRVAFGLDTLARSPITTASEFSTSYFTTMIRYLGPLRADPQAAQGFAPSSEPDDVGYKGEYAASVFDANKHQRIVYWDPFAQREAQTRLDEAMDTWLRYLGVGHHVLTREAGLSGVSWCLQQTPDSKERPLHAVGIGVSQVLPILVAGLLAPQGALFLIEQPELHLHERAQARLGDFFFGLSQVGKQCIIETHSVCLVNQLRYQIVKGGSTVRDATTLYFVEQDERGDSQFAPVKISEAGNILNWPDGFFDEVSLQEELITQESVRARVRSGARRSRER